LWILPLTGDHKPLPFLQTPFSEQDGVLSPDSNWIAYSSDESGRSEIFVQPFPSSNPKLQGKWQVSAGGGSHPHWGPEGREIFFMSPDGMILTVPVDALILRPGTPQPLFSARGADSRAGFALSPDGKRFLIPIPETEQAPASATVVLNWTAALRH
jgi:hypothetical protein